MQFAQVIGYELNPDQRGGYFMKDTFRNTPQFHSTKNKLDEAIDNMDISEIEKQIDILSANNPFPYPIEDSKLFAKRIIKQNKEGYDTMKKNHKKFAAIAASLILTITIGVTAAYATGLFKEFNFFNKNTTVKIKTTQDMSDDEAQKMAQEASDSYNNPKDPQKETKQVDTQSFPSIEKVKEALGIDIVLPAYIPEDFEMDKDIKVQSPFDKNFNIYTTYKSKENTERLLGITIISENLPEDSTHITVTDAVYQDTYTTPTGTQYTLFNEDKGVIASIEIDNIQYALVFMGLSEDEMHKVIDSVDLSTYTK
jgi:hypothetical protein